MSGEALATIIVAIIMSIPGTLGLFKQLKKDREEAYKIEAEKETEKVTATEKIQEAALKMMGIYKAEFESMKNQISTLECRVEELESILKQEMEEKKNVIAGAWRLHNQLLKKGEIPEYVPPKPKG